MARQRLKIRGKPASPATVARVFKIPRKRQLQLKRLITAIVRDKRSTVSLRRQLARKTRRRRTLA